jgi:hypothetical protein
VSRHVHGRLTFANVVSLIALFVALGGSSYAAVTLRKGSKAHRLERRHLSEGEERVGRVAQRGGFGLGRPGGLRLAVNGGRLAARYSPSP